jgi:hypothetical protein
MEYVDSDSLISTAGEAGFDLGERSKALRRLESWRDNGLLPRQDRVGQQGKRPIWAYPEGTDRQLLALLRWRKVTRDLDSIRVALWVEGYAIATPDARASLLKVLNRYATVVDSALDERRQRVASDCGREPELEEVVESLAGEAAGKRANPPAPKTIRMPFDERVRGFTYLIRLGLGLGLDDVPAEDAKLAERAIGLAAARRGQEPYRWLDGPPEQLSNLANVFSLPALEQAASSATEEELEFARRIAQLLTAGLPLIGLWAESLLGPRAAGLAMTNTLWSPDPDWFCVLVPGIINAARQGMHGNLAMIGDSLKDVPDVTKQLNYLASLSPEERQEALQKVPEQDRPQARRFVALYEGKRRQTATKQGRKNKAD